MKTLLLLLSFSVTCLAQQSLCGLTSIKETAPLLYPPIAKAAHVEGMVILLVVFKRSGEVDDVEVLSGPKLLQIPASLYGKGLRANEYGGPRTCPMVVNYVIQKDEAALRPIERNDIQHVTIYAKPLVISDPPMYVEKAKKRF